MKLSTVFLALALALPAASHAANVKESAFASFELTDPNAQYDVSVGYSWNDLVYSVTKTKGNGRSTTTTSIVDATDGGLRWVLSSSILANPLRGFIVDPANAASGSGLLPTFSNLAAGSYTLTLKGHWDYPNLDKQGTTVIQDADVSLGTPAILAIGASNPPPIPEPDTYAMLIAGLGLMGTVARRRNSRL